MNPPVRKIRSLAQIDEVNDLHSAEAYLQQGRRLIIEQRVRQLCVIGQGVVVTQESERLLSNLQASLNALNEFRLLLARDVAKGPYHDKAAAVLTNKHEPQHD